jgi:hypothetical protein
MQSMDEAATRLIFPTQVPSNMQILAVSPQRIMHRHRINHPIAAVE